MRFFKWMLLILGLSFLNQVREDVYEACRSYFWIETQGEILESYVKTSQEGEGIQEIHIFKPFVSYRFKVRNVEYKNQRINFNRYIKDKNDSESFVSRYPAGKKIRVYYDGRDPNHSVLEPGISPKAVGQTVVGALLSLAALLMSNLKKFLKRLLFGIFMIQSGVLMLYSQADQILAGGGDWFAVKSMVMNSSGFALVYGGYKLIKPLIQEYALKIRNFYYSWFPGKKSG